MGWKSKPPKVKQQKLSDVLRQMREAPAPAEVAAVSKSEALPYGTPTPFVNDMSDYGFVSRAAQISSVLS